MIFGSWNGEYKFDPNVLRMEPLWVWFNSKETQRHFLLQGDRHMSMKQCPHCKHEDSVEHFGTWEKDGKRGFLGKTPEGFIMLLCPNCDQEIKYDTLGRAFLKPDQAARSGIIFNLLFVGFIIAIVFFVIKLFF